jgi:hypothetical protein
MQHTGQLARLCGVSNQCRSWQQAGVNPGMHGVQLSSAQPATQSGKRGTTVHGCSEVHNVEIAG